MPVDRCVCADISFERLKRIARERGLDFETLRRETGAGLGCGLCAPYIERVLTTGRTSFDLLSPDAAQREEPPTASSAPSS